MKTSGATTSDLRDLARKNNIIIEDGYAATKPVAASCEVGGVCAVMIRRGIGRDTRLYRECLSHELGHCMTGSFYNRLSPCDVVSRHEYRADAWAIEMILPPCDMKRALDAGCREVWEIGEYLDLSAAFVEKAVAYYKTTRYGSMFVSDDEA